MDKVTRPVGTESITWFYAVTLTSVYRLRAVGKFRSTATKMAKKVNSPIPIGRDISGGGMVAIGRCLQGYLPEGNGSP